MATPRRLLVDISPLRESREFRLLWGGQIVSFFGRQLTVVAIPVQVWDLTGSSFAVGLVSLAALVPLVGFSLVGGAIADAVDRRRLLIVANLGLALTSVGLALNAHRAAPALWPLYVLSACAAGLSGVEQPTRGAVAPNLIRRDLLPAAAALNQILLQTGLALGPAVAGPIIAYAGFAAAYWVDVATFGVAVGALVMMRPLPPEGGGTRAGLASVREGLAYLKGKAVLQATFWIDLDAMVFGMPRALFPALAATVFGGGPTTVGLLLAASGFGALIGALASGWVGRIRRQGRAVFLAVAGWGAAIVMFGMTRSLPVALVLLAFAGWADMVSAVFRNTILQVTTPDALRGRLTAVHVAVVTGGPRLGDAEAGGVAALAGNRFSVVSGGALCLVGLAVIARLLPQLARYDADHPDPIGSSG